MAHNSKKAVALVLTAMMAATALAGCGGSSGNQQSQAPAPSGTESQAPSGTESQAPSGENSTAAPSVDLFSEEMTAQIKDKIAAEAEKTDNKISLKIWCASNDAKLEKYLVEKFKTLYSDSRYELSIKVAPGIGEDNAGDQILQDPTKGDRKSVV